MYIEVKSMHSMAMVYMFNYRKNPVVRYRSFLDTLYINDYEFYII